MSAYIPSRPRAFAWMALAATLFGIMNLFARLSSEHAHWTVVAAVRALIGALVAIGIARARGVPAIVVGGRAMWLRSLFGTAAMACSFYALTSRYLPLADSVTLNNTTPLFLALLSPYLLRESGGLRVAIAIPISMVGVVLIVRPPFLFGDAHRAAYFADAAGLVSYHAALAPASIALVGALCSAIAMLSLRRAAVGETPEAIAAHFSIVAFVVHGILALILADAPSLRSVPFMILAGLSAGCAQVAMTRSYGLERASRVSGIAYLQVVVGATFGALVLQEPLALGAVAGIAMVVFGGALLMFLGILDARNQIAARAGSG